MMVFTPSSMGQVGDTAKNDYFESRAPLRSAIRPRLLPGCGEMLAILNMQIPAFNSVVAWKLEQPLLRIRSAPLFKSRKIELFTDL